MKLTVLAVVSSFLLAVNELKHGAAAPANEDLEERRLVNVLNELLREKDGNSEVRKTLTDENHPVAQNSYQKGMERSKIATKAQASPGLERKDAAKDMLARLLGEITGESLSETEHVAHTKKNAYQFHSMTEHMTGRESWHFLDYGCYCGGGNMGEDIEPVDELDWCCRVHDLCYKQFKVDCPDFDGSTPGSGPQYTYYSWDEDNAAAGNGLKCSETNEYSWWWGHRECRKQLCECDKAAAICLSENPYNDDHWNYVKRGLIKRDEDRCTTVLPGVKRGKRTL